MPRACGPGWCRRRGVRCIVALDALQRLAGHLVQQLVHELLRAEQMAGADLDVRGGSAAPPST